RGRGAKIAVIEWAYWPGHEDLNVIGEPGQTMILIPAITSPDHGTACLGIMNALNNNTGVTGMVHEAQGYFFPLTSIEEGPREMAAWTSALQTLGAGDVISASYGPGPPIGCLNNDQSMWTMFRLASDLGITVCVAAGNDCYNLDNAEDLGDSGAIVVGACSPGSPHYRLAFSNFCTDPPADNSRSNMVHLKAWGEAVTTCGYGVLPLPDGDITRSYTPVFGGTSAASPQVASVACMLQGLSKQFYGITLSPEMLRDAMGAPGPPPAPTRLFGGFPPDQDCNLDLDPDEGPHRIGSYPDPAGAASTLLSQWFVGFDDSPRLEDVVVVKGQNTRGNRFSLKGSDNNYLKIDPQWVGRNDSPQSPFGGQGVGGGVFGGSIIPQVSQLRYLASGWMVDIVAVGRSDLPSVGTLIVENEVAWPNVFTFMMIEMYDWQQLNWAFVDVRVGAEQAERTDPTNGDVTFEHTTDGAARFVNPTDDRILVRVWSLGFPAFQAGVGGGDTSFLKQFDLINFFVAEGFGVPLP
ncbi:MAG: S8 family serine peptidase, partial [Planctomycetes bacterium]|nr:S8 family serine peptidase [Planctomycetota bacterium]